MKNNLWRYVWTYVDWDPKLQKRFLACFISPDKDATHPEQPTPYEYITSRSDVRYLICSQVELTKEQAILTSETLYNEEFGKQSIERRNKMPVRR